MSKKISHAQVQISISILHHTKYFLVRLGVRGKKDFAAAYIPTRKDLVVCLRRQKGSNFFWPQTITKVRRRAETHVRSWAVHSRCGGWCFSSSTTPGFFGQRPASSGIHTSAGRRSGCCNPPLVLIYYVYTPSNNFPPHASLRGARMNWVMRYDVRIPT